MGKEGNHKVFDIARGGFDALALEIFREQVARNDIYRDYTAALHINPEAVTRLEQIPFLPIRFFKTHTVRAGLFEPAVIFESSGTTGTINSRHGVKDLSLYEESFTRGFELFYGPVKEYCIIGLLPTYLERKNASLVYMVDKLVRLSGHPQSGFYLDEYEKLATELTELEKKQQKTFLIGVTFALLDFAEQFPITLTHTNIIETGGMKGRKKEMIREEVHAVLKERFGLPAIHSEYGMTELLSQAYSKGEGIFNCPPWMKVLLRDEEDPLLIKNAGSGAVNIIDLVNIHSCSFIATDDAGRLYADESFEILGRMDGSDLRGCGLMLMG
jgi:phenylacetate-coenzyme A ligase PaaK-like adenylate-forming protein